MRHGIFFFLLFVSLPLFGQPIEKKDRVAFSNISPGELENPAIKSFPVKITMSSESKAPYGGVYIRIFNASGVAIFKHLCEKPWLFLRIPPGEYHVVGVDRKKVTRLKPFKVKPEGAGQTVVNLVWPKETVGY